MTQKNGRKENNKCQDINIPAGTAENSYPQMTIHALSVAKSIQSDPNDAQNAETR
jgi:hypothetical protein